MTKKRRMTGVVTLVIMVLFMVSWLGADEPGEIFQELKDTMQAFKEKESDSDVIKKWSNEATSDEALTQLATDLCKCEAVRRENVFTERSKPEDRTEWFAGNIVSDRINGITIIETSGNGPYFKFEFKPEWSDTKYIIMARYQEGVWKLYGYKYYYFQRVLCNTEKIEFSK